MPVGFDDNGLDGSLDWKVGRIVTIFTRSGGRSGRGFTGILLEANCDFIKLITTLPSSPRSPFIRGFEDRDDGRCCHNRNRRNPLGTIVVIPRSEIVAFVFNEI